MAGERLKLCLNLFVLRIATKNVFNIPGKANDIACSVHEIVWDEEVVKLETKNLLFDNFISVVRRVLF